MAIGDFNNGSSNSGYQNNKPYENTYYSRVRFKNGERQLNISYHSGLMQIDMGYISQTDGFKFNKETSVYISPNKALLLADQISAFLAYRESDNIDPVKAFGVNTGMGEKVSFIGFSTDSDKKIYVTIGKFDGTGVITEKFRFEFANDYHFGIEWNNIEENDIVKVFNNDLEIKMLQQALVDFSRAMVGASAYGVVDLARWDTHRMNKRVDQIFDKLGIERTTYNNNKSAGTNNFLSGAASSSKSTSLEDVEDLLS
jgi:hypothetical protein